MVTTRRQSLAARGPAPAQAGWVRQPAERKPDFTLGQLRKAVPPHCWRRSAWRSGAYLARDLAMLAVLVYASSFIDAAPVPPAVRWGLLWPLYWFFASAVATGCWVSGAHAAVTGRRAVAGGRHPAPAAPAPAHPLLSLGVSACIAPIAPMNAQSPLRRATTAPACARSSATSAGTRPSQSRRCGCVVAAGCGAALALPAAPSLTPSHQLPTRPPACAPAAAPLSSRAPCACMPACRSRLVPAAHPPRPQTQAVNDGVGLVVHSLLLVPYYSWKHSHRRHHSNTGSLAKDEVCGGRGRALGWAACACVHEGQSERGSGRQELPSRHSSAASGGAAGRAGMQGAAGCSSVAACVHGTRHLPRPALPPPGVCARVTPGGAPRPGARAALHRAVSGAARARGLRQLRAHSARTAAPGCWPPPGFPRQATLPLPATWPLPARSLVKLAVTLTLGWPLYLFFNVASRPYDKAWGAWRAGGCGAGAAAGPRLAPCHAQCRRRRRAACCCAALCRPPSPPTTQTRQSSQPL